MQLQSDFERSVERLYEVFGHYGRKEHMESCPCCRGPESIRPLYDRPLRELTPQNLHFYTFCAMTTMGDVDDFRHFLPRILELLRNSEFLAHVSSEVVLGKLRYGKWENWPEEEQRAVREYIHTVWRIVLQIPPPDSPYEIAEIGDWLCAVARAEHDLSPYLDAWRAEESPAAGANLARFVADYNGELTGVRQLTGYWEDAPEQWAQVAQWIAASGSEDPIKA
jgi:hypothetical protein